MKQSLLALLLCLVMVGCSAANAPGEPADAGQSGIDDTQVTEPVEPPPPPPPPEPIESTLVVIGDIMNHLPQVNDAFDGEKYDYTNMMGAVAPYATAADCAVGNFETTLAGGPPYSGYPAFNSPDDLAYSLKDMGFDLMLTANNHSLDRGGKAVIRTLDVMDEAGLRHVGTSRTQEEYDNNIQVMDVGGISVAFLGYTYGTNGIPTPKDAPYAVNLFNTDYLTHMSTLDEEKVRGDLEKAKALDTDLIAVMIHWGVEYQTKQNSYQEQVADFLFQNGADIILGGHAHVLQPMELRTVTMPDGTEKQGFVCYSLGNFISAQNDPLTDTTVVLTLELKKDLETNETTIEGFNYRPMLMLDREAGAEVRFQLLDVYAEIAKGDGAAVSQARLQQCIEDCHRILGAEHDVGAAE